MQEIYDLHSLEKSISDTFEEDSGWLISMPNTKKVFESQFSLTNKELSIDKIGFYDAEDTIDINLVSEIPKNQKEFKERFSL